MKKKLNLTEVAKLLGVSIATVSNAFNRPDQLSEKLRERIMTESAKLGYHGPNLAARSLRMGASGIIGVMLSDSLSYSFSDPVASQLLQGIAEVLVENQKQMLLLSSDVHTAEQSSAESLPDGLIVYGTIPTKTMEQIQRIGKPIVIVDFQAINFSSVNIDNQSGAYAIAEHAFTNSISKQRLQEDDDSLNTSILGLKLIEIPRVCRLTEDDFNNPLRQLSQLRLNGYLEAASSHNVEITAEKVWNIPINNHHYAEIAAREALMTSDRPSVLLCMSDIIALSAVKVAKSLGLRVPEDVQITGFDDIPEASRSEPGITTICQQSIEKGRVAARMLLDSIKDDAETQHLKLATRLVIRNSCPQ
ncbi:MAG: DNA-binding LacI/PurR family transcriptional regulator [Glaciecola sp.]|jgi:DNA-binding LacI/PurR family transcriptional regulator